MISYARKIALVGIVLLVVFSIGYAEVPTWIPCENSGLSGCTVHEVRVYPCRETEMQKSCRLRRGINATLAFDYTLNFASEKLDGRMYWTKAHSSDMEFPFLNPNACLKTQCPTTPGQKQNYLVRLHVSKQYSKRIYNVKFKLTNPTPYTNQGCCFIFSVKLHDERILDD